MEDREQEPELPVSLNGLIHVGTSLPFVWEKGAGHRKYNRTRERFRASWDEKARALGIEPTEVYMAVWITVVTTEHARTFKRFLPSLTNEALFRRALDKTWEDSGPPARTLLPEGVEYENHNAVYVLNESPGLVRSDSAFVFWDQFVEQLRQLTELLSESESAGQNGAGLAFGRRGPQPFLTDRWGTRFRTQPPKGLGAVVSSMRSSLIVATPPENPMTGPQM